MNPRIIGIAGGTGSGKTTIADKLVAHYGEDNCLRISSDNYYRCLKHLPHSQRKINNFDIPDSIEFDLLIEHLKKLSAANEEVLIPEYDFKEHCRAPGTIKKSKPIIIVEGILIMYLQTLRELFHVKVFVETADYISIFRRIDRDRAERGRTYEEARDQYINTVGPANEEYVQPTKKHVDIIITNSSFDFKINIEQIITAINTQNPALRFFETHKPVSALYSNKLITTVNANSTPAPTSTDLQSMQNSNGFVIS